MNKIVLKIKGMHCDGCAKRIEKILNSKDEIKSVKVDLSSKTAEVEYNNLAIEAIIKLIENAGFEAKIK